MSADYVVVDRGTGSSALAQPIKDTLEAAGIDCMIDVDSEIWAATAGMPKPTWVLRVPADDVKEARAILNQAEEPFPDSEYVRLRAAIHRQPLPPARRGFLIGAAAFALAASVLLVVIATMD